MSVPVAAMDENHGSLLANDNIWPTGQLTIV
jgi:hypothetical protein